MKMFENVNRVELIVEGKRMYVTYDAKECMIDLQDSDRTLKVFLKVR